jgi:hypothetical protein
MNITLATLLTLLSFISTSLVHAFDYNDPIFDTFLDSELVYHQTQVPTPQEIISILRSLGAIDLLQEDFFLKTNVLNSRNIIDSPLFMSPWSLPCDRLFAIYLFFNQSNDKNFTLRRNTINSYLSVGEGSFMNKLQRILEGLNQFLIFENFDSETLIDIFSLFENFTVQERKLGFMFAGQKMFKNCTQVRIMTPFYWLERNYFVDCQVQQLLQEILDPITGTPSPKEQDEFQREHLISDALGIGDTRLEVDWLVQETKSTRLRAGFLCTIPSAFAIKNGLYGNYFSRNRRRPVLDIQRLTESFINPETRDLAIQEIGCFGFTVLNNLSAMLLTTDLGNNGHVGFGPLVYLESYLSKYINRPWADCFRMYARYSLEFQLPAKQRLFYIQKDSTAGFCSRDFTDDAQATSNLAFLQETLTNRLFPFNFSTITGPTLIFRSTTRSLYEGEHWGGFIGFDTYARTKQNIYSVDTSPTIVCSLAQQKAASAWIWQSKLLGGLSYHHESDRRITVYSLNGDKTFLTKGLGRDFSLSCNIDINF